MRARGARRVHPPLLGGGLRGPPRVHRARDPAHLARLGHPADDLAGAGRRRRFPFVDPPDERQVADGVRLLEELGAFATGEPGRGRHRGRGRRLTASGTTLARLPLDPRLGRMVIEAGRLGCTREVLVIVAALSIQDPRERPVDKEAQADQSHARFKDERSDFATLHNLWLYLKEQQKELSHSAFRRMCKAEYLHYLRIREWQDLHAQLRPACRSVRIDPDVATSARDAEPDWDTIHKALLAGLLSHVGARDEAKREYAGARGARFGISPGSALFRKQPDLVMAGRAGRDEPAVGAGQRRASSPSGPRRSVPTSWRRTVSEPRWSRKAGARRRHRAGHALRGAARHRPDDPVRADRPRGAPARSSSGRALVEGDWDAAARLLAATTSPRSRGVAELEERARRRDIVVDDEALFAFYDARIPPDVLDRAALRPVVARRAAPTPDLLTLTEDAAHLRGRRAGLGRRLPAHLAAGRPRPRRDLPVLAGRGGRRRHRARAGRRAQPGDRPTGSTGRCPGCATTSRSPCSSRCPRRPAATSCPTPDHAVAALRRAPTRRAGTLADELARVLRERTGIRVPPGEWDLARVPDHLRVTFSVEGAGGRVVARGKDLDALRDRGRRSGARPDGAGRGRRWSAPA